VEGGVITDVKVDDVLARLDSLSDEDRAAQRTNPFAFSVSTQQLVTADEIAVSDQSIHAGGFACPSSSCKAELRHHTNARGTPFFSHVGSRGDCTSGHETPAHLCIKRGLEAIGMLTEHYDDVLRLKYDAFDPASGQAVEVVCSGIERYMEKLTKTSKFGVHVNWLFDSAAKGLATKDGTERLCLASWRAGTVVARGFFAEKAHGLLAAIPADRLFMFYRGLIWRSVGIDRWQLLDDTHPFNIAAGCDGGMKHLMIKMHLANAETVTENKNRGIYRKTWFDSRFRYRGRNQKETSFTMTWGRDREYIEEQISRLVADLSAVQSTHQSQKGIGGASEPGDAKHSSAEEIVSKVTANHSPSITEIQRLRHIVDQTRKESSLVNASLSAAVVRPLLVGGASGTAAAKREIRSSRWEPDRSPANHRALMHEANKKLQEARAMRAGPAICQCGSTNIVVRRQGVIRWNECVSCRKPVGYSWTERTSHHGRK
jgi:hypothetical protein